MRLAHILILLLLGLSCSGPRFTSKLAAVSSPTPAVTILTEEEHDRELQRLDLLPPIDNRAEERAIAETFVKFETNQVHVLTAGTDSLEGGLDNWRTCAKLSKNEIFDVPERYAMVFYTVDNEPCEGHPTAIVGQVVAIFPGNRVDPLKLPFNKSPSHGNEQMRLGTKISSRTQMDH